MIADIITAALLLWAALTGAAGDSPYKGEIVAAGMATAWHESRWEPQAAGDSNCSLGYMQFNRCGGLGAPYTRAQLLDGPTNARLFVEWAHVHLAAGYDMADILQPWSVRWPALEMAQGMEGASPWDWVRLVVGDNEVTLLPPGTPGKAVEVTE